MNSLSWMIYLAEVCGNIGAVLAVGGFFGLVSAAVSAVLGYVVFAGPVDSWSWETADQRAANAASKRLVSSRLQRVAIPLLVTSAVAIGIACIIPSKDSVYAIAASEAGERALKSETGDKALKALNAWLDKQITPSKPESDKRDPLGHPFDVGRFRRP